MTQTLDAHERIAVVGTSRGNETPASQTSATSATTADKFGVFAITFAIAFAILYTQFERLNWPFFTYHPAVGKVDFWMHPPRSGEGPPMYWYGWLALSFPCAALIGWIATLLSPRALLRTTVFGCILAVVWSIMYAVGIYMDERTRFDTDLVKTIGWMAGIPAVVVSLALSYFVPMQWVQRTWSSLVLIMPVWGLVILGYSLKNFFLR
jgi:hypothetical protein